MTRDLDTPVALVTGAARNIGLAIATRLQRDGFLIVGTAYGGDALSGLGAPAGVTRAEAADLGSERDWDIVHCDLADAQQCNALVQRICDRFGRLDCIVHNAATWTYGRALDVPDSDWQRVLDVNVLALVRLARSSYPLLQQAPNARIVAISSIGADWAGNGVAPYNVSKAAVSCLVRALAVEFAEDGIAVNAVAPGFINTSSNAHELEDRLAFDRHMRLIPTGRLGQPDDVANVVSFLASPTLQFVTGTVVRIDGGQLAGAGRHLLGESVSDE